MTRAMPEPSEEISVERQDRVNSSPAWLGTCLLVMLTLGVGVSYAKPGDTPPPPPPVAEHEQQPGQGAGKGAAATEPEPEPESEPQARPKSGPAPESQPPRRLEPPHSRGTRPELERPAQAPAEPSESAPVGKGSGPPTEETMPSEAEPAGKGAASEAEPERELDPEPEIPTEVDGPDAPKSSGQRPPDHDAEIIDTFADAQPADSARGFEIRPEPEVGAGVAVVPFEAGAAAPGPSRAARPMTRLEQSALSALLRAWQLPASASQRFVLRERATDALGRTRVTFDQSSGGYLIFGYEVHGPRGQDREVIAITGLQADVPEQEWAPPSFSAPGAAEAAGLGQGSLLAMSEAPVIYVTDVGADLVYPFERYDGLRRTFMLLSADDRHVVDIIEGTYTGARVAAD